MLGLLFRVRDARGHCFFLSLALAGCAAEVVETGRSAPLSWEEFRDSAYQEPDTGIYIVDTDVPILDRPSLEAYYLENVAPPYLPSPSEMGPVEQLAQGGDYGVLSEPLLVNRVGNRDDTWGIGRRRNLRYCVSTNFNGAYDRVVAAMRQASADWNDKGRVNLRHLSAQDSRCNARNTNVDFDVRPAANSVPYLARAFFPSFPRASRNVLIRRNGTNGSGPYSLGGILRHELGHVLGFRHEHTRNQNNRCFEDRTWRALTAYDRKSVMHYPFCDGTNTGDLRISRRDIEGLRAIYGVRTRRLRSIQTGARCVASPNNGTNVRARVRNCPSGNNRNADLRFEYLWAGNYNYDVQVRNGHGQCLTSMNGQVGVYAQFRTCGGSGARNQRWRLLNANNGTVRLQTGQSGRRCLSAEGGAQNRQLRMRACSGNRTRFRTPLNDF